MKMTDVVVVVVVPPEVEKVEDLIRFFFFFLILVVPVEEEYCRSKALMRSKLSAFMIFFVFDTLKQTVPVLIWEQESSISALLGNR